MKKKNRTPRLWKSGTLTWMMTDDRSGTKHTTDIENLEGRRGSIPLARLKQEEADFFDLIERGNVDVIERFLNVSLVIDVV